MDINNKKIFFLGDSITEGYGASVWEENSYVALFQKAYPNAEILNYGISGTCIAKTPGWTKDFIARVDKMQEDAELVVIFGGTNDYNHGQAPIGKFGDTSPFTFYGGVRTLYEKLLCKYPKSKFLVLTPLHRIEETQANSRGEYFEQFVNAIRETAELFSFPVLDLYAVSGINPRFGRIKETFMPDGLHPNDAGYQRLFELIDRYIKYRL